MPQAHISDEAFAMILSTQKHILTHPGWLRKQRHSSCCV